MVILIMKREVKAAWKDEEDEKTQVDISQVARLRKLKQSEDENEISGVDY